MKTAFAWLTVLALASGCAKEPEEKFAGPKDDPMTGKWAIATKELFFAEVEFAGGNQFVLHEAATQGSHPPGSEVVLERERHSGRYEILKREEITHSNGKWTELMVKLSFVGSSCPGVRNVPRVKRVKLRFYYPRDKSEFLFWDEEIPSRRPLNQMVRIHMDDPAKKDAYKNYARVKELRTGCIIDGRFAPSR